MNKIYSFSLKKGVVLSLADYFKQRFTKFVIKIIIHGRNIRYMFVLNGQCNWFIWMVTFIGVLEWHT